MESDSLERFGFIVGESKQPNTKQTRKIRSYPMYRDTRIILEKLKRLGINKEDSINFALILFFDDVEKMTEEERNELIQSMKPLKTPSFSDSTI